MKVLGQIGSTPLQTVKGSTVVTVKKNGVLIITIKTLKETEVNITRRAKDISDTVLLTVNHSDQVTYLNE